MVSLGDGSVPVKKTFSLVLETARKTIVFHALFLKSFVSLVFNQILNESTMKAYLLIKYPVLNWISHPGALICDKTLINF